MQEIRVWFVGGENPLEKEIAIHCGILARRIPKDRGAWQGCSPCSHKSVGHDLATKQSESPYLLLFSYLLIGVCVCVCVWERERERETETETETENILFQSFKFMFSWIWTIWTICLKQTNSCLFFCFHLTASHAAGNSLAPKKMNSPFCTMQTEA